MSWAFITALKRNPQQSYVQLLNSIREELEAKYTQKPQLSCSHPLSKSLSLSYCHDAFAKTGFVKGSGGESSDESDVEEEEDTKMKGIEEEYEEEDETCSEESDDTKMALDPSGGGGCNATR